MIFSTTSRRMLILVQISQEWLFSKRCILFTGMSYWFLSPLKVRRYYSVTVLVVTLHEEVFIPSCYRIFVVPLTSPHLFSQRGWTLLKSTSTQKPLSGPTVIVVLLPPLEVLLLNLHPFNMGIFSQELPSTLSNKKILKPYPQSPVSYKTSTLTQFSEYRSI